MSASPVDTDTPEPHANPPLELVRTSPAARQDRAGRTGPVDVVAEEFGLTRDEVEDAIRASTREAA